MSRLVARYLRPRPEFNLDKCVGCGDCVLNCPSDALKMKENFPELDLENCTRCFCCQELCSKEAVSIKRPLLGKILFT
ncbi:MAG: 4Fe-4S dicluster domain-containing protein [bacterium]